MSGNTGFQFKYNLAGRTSGILREFKIYNSLVVAIGDMVYLTGGGVGPCPAATPIMGCCVGIVDKNGTPITDTPLTVSGSWSATNKAYTAASDNMTVDMVRAVVDIDPFSVWSATPDATLGTDDQSDMAGSYTDLVTSAGDQPDEDSAATTQCQLFIWGVDPELSTNGLYSIAQHQLWGWTVV